MLKNIFEIIENINKYMDPKFQIILRKYGGLGYRKKEVKVHSHINRCFYINRKKFKHGFTKF